MTDPRAALVAAVGAALQAETGQPTQVRHPADVAAFVAAAEQHRVVGLLCDQHEAIGLPTEVFEPLKQAHLRIAMASLRRAADTVRYVSALQSAGIETLVLKGVALSMQTTGTLNSRDTRDVDLLVSPDDMPRAHESLLATGARYRHRMYPGDSAEWRFARWANRELTYYTDPGELDLHWRVANELGWFPDAKTLLARAEVVSVGSASLPTLSQSDALIAGCLFAHIDRYNSLRYLVDIHRLLAHGAQVPPDSSNGLRRLTADTIGFASELIPGWPAQTLPAEPNTRYAWQQWERVDVPMGIPKSYAALFSSARRYSPLTFSATARLLSVLSLYPEDLEPHGGLRSVTRAISAKMQRLPTAGEGIGA